MKQFLVVAYDITDERRRRRIAKTLEKYGLRCNESVFECMLTQSKINLLQQQLLKLTDKSSDSILYYFLCLPCAMKRESIGYRPSFIPETIMV